jgi:uncharacterized protein with GYD domain
MITFGEVQPLFFVILGKWKEKMSKATVDQANTLIKKMNEMGIKFIGQYWTLGSYDFVSIVEAKDEKTQMNAMMQWSHLISTESLTAIPRQEAIKLVE